jgi:hypothetical protein
MSRDASATARAVLWQCVAKARRMGAPDERGDGDAKSWDRYLKQRRKGICRVFDFDPDSLHLVEPSEK